jgi:hypothetical protein
MKTSSAKCCPRLLENSSIKLQSSDSNVEYHSFAIHSVARIVSFLPQTCSSNLKMEKSPDIPPSEVGADVTESGSAPLTVSPRQNISAWKWIIMCIALYLGALLYGIMLFHLVRASG